MCDEVSSFWVRPVLSEQPHVESAGGKVDQVFKRGRGIQLFEYELPDDKDTKI
jgi:hypothetical protein